MERGGPKALPQTESISTYRERRHLTAEQLAAASGLRPERIERLETGAEKPTRPLLVNLSQVLGVPLERLAPWAALALLFALGLAGSALADPPPGSPGPFASWYHSLTVPGTSLSCCSSADYRPVEWRQRDAHYEAFIDKVQFTAGPGEWVRVPQSKILRRSNPTGFAQACWTIWGGILCFVLPSLT